jgi:hypothetical protein
MNRQRFIQLAVAALVVIAGGWYLAAQRNRVQETAGIALLPTLENDANAITAVTVRKGAAAPTVTLRKSGDRWTVAERADYPADTPKLRKLLQSLRDARIVEEKTSDPALFASIGVEDPAAAGATGAEVTVIAPSGRIGVIVGKTAGEGNFVRRSGENRTFTVEPGISVESEPRFWIDSKLLDVQAAMIQSIDVKLAGEAAYTLRRLNPADNTYGLDAVPAGRKALDGHALAPGPTTFSGLTAEDVGPSGTVDFGQGSQAVVTLSDGTILTLTGAVAGDKHWIEVKDSKDAALTARTQGRAFELAAYRYDAIFKPVEQLLEPKPAAGAAKPPANGAPAARKPPTKASAPAHPAPTPGP